MSIRRPSSALFRAGAIHAEEIDERGIPVLQRFFELNPDYFCAVNGQPAGPGEAHEEVHGALPDGWPFSKKWIIGFVDDAGALVGVANVVSDLLAHGVWHIGLFMIASRLHGIGVAQSLYNALESWTQSSGAKWLRLGVVEGNTRAERFWERCGFVEFRKRTGMEMGVRSTRFA